MLPAWIEKPFSRLDESQREAATADPSSTTLVQAGAGSGKTQTMACRIAFLIACGVSPLSILGICFTRKAAEELRSRVAWALQGSPYAMDARRLKLRTLHAFGLENLRRYDKIDDSTDVYDQRRQVGLAKEVVVAHACASRDSDAADRLVEYVNTVKTKKALPPRETNPQNQEAYLFPHYQEMLHRDRNGVDFGDLQLMFYELLKPLKAPQAQTGADDRASTTNDEEEEGERSPPRSLPSPACASLRHRYTHIIVDEFQDLNEVQFEIIALLAGDACRVTCVGDPNQCIYGWRGALPHIFHQWKRRFPRAEERVLRINYRSDPPIVSAANGIVRATQQPFHSRRNLRTVLVGCVDAEEEYDALPFMIQHFVRVRENQLRYGDIAVLCRTRARVGQCVDALRDHGIPVVELKSTAADGVSSMASLLAYFRLCVNPHRDDDVHEVLIHAPHALSPRVSRAFFMSLYASRDDLRRRDAWGDSVVQTTTARTRENGDAETRSHACEPLGARYSLYNVLRQLVHHGFAPDVFPLMCKVTKPTATVLRELITVVEAARQLFDEFNYRFEGRPVGPTVDDVADVVADCMDVVLTKAHFESAGAAVEFMVVSHKKEQAGPEGSRKRSRATHDAVVETARANGTGRRGGMSSSATLADAVAQTFSLEGHAEAPTGAARSRSRSRENKQDGEHSTALADAAASAFQDEVGGAGSEPVSKRLTLRDLLFSAIANVRQETALAHNNNIANEVQQTDLFPVGAAVVKREAVTTTALDSATPSVIDVDAESDNDTNGSGSLIACSAKVEPVRAPPPSQPPVSLLQPLQRPEQLLLYVLDEFATLLPSDDFGPLKLQATHGENGDASSGHDIRTTAAVSVGTVHSAKGLEWPAVLLPSCYDGHYPLSNDPEERRVFYVAMSRAQTQLVMITAQRHVVPVDPKVPKGPSRVESLMTTPFVVEIAKQRGTVRGTFADVKPHQKNAALASTEVTAQEGSDVDVCGSIQLFDYAELKRGYHEQQLQVGVVPVKQ